MTTPRRKSVSNEFEPNLFISLSLRVILAVLVTVVAICIAKVYIRCEQKCIKSEKLTSSNELKLWSVTMSTWNPNGALRTMNRVFSNLGYRLVNASEGEDWDFLWSIEYPFAKGHIHKKTNLYEPLFKMNFSFLPHQRVNHIPGFFAITNKLNLGLKTDSKYILPTFVFPDMIKQFDEYNERHPKAKWVEKNYNNRGVQLVDLDEIEYDQSLKLYQLFMDKPFLIDGHAFDFGVYVLITSVNPLRIYRYSHENYIRFCPEEYYPFDPKDIDKYVVEGDHIGAYEMPSFTELYEDFGYSFKMIFEKIIRKEGFDVAKFWKRIDDAIVDVILKNEGRIVEKIREENFDFSHHFFELVRFDIILDVDLNPYVMEVNMSPNLTPISDEYEDHALIYEQLVFNTIRLIGGGSYYDMMTRISNDTIISNFKNLATNLDECVELNCADNCDKIECKVCLPCANDFLRFQMQESYREHSRRGNFKRVFPSSVHFNDNKFTESLNFNNQVMVKWFEAQCGFDKSFC